MRQKLLLAFILANLFALSLRALFPSLPLFPYSPLFALWIASLSLPYALWSAFGMGLFMDLLSSSPMGIHAINFCLTTLVLYRERRHFVSDNPYNLSLFTLLFSFVSALFYALLISLFDRRMAISGKWVLTDLLLLPIADGVYAFVWFTLPFMIGEKVQKRIKLYLKGN